MMKKFVYIIVIAISAVIIIVSGLIYLHDYITLITVISTAIAIVSGLIYFYDRFTTPRLLLWIPTERYHTYNIQPESLDICPAEWKKQKCLKYFIHNESKYKSIKVKEIVLHLGSSKTHYNTFDTFLKPNDKEEHFLPITHPLLFFDNKIEPHKQQEGNTIFYSAECFLVAIHQYGASTSNIINMHWKQLDLNKIEKVLNKIGWNTISIDRELIKLEKYGCPVFIFNDGRISERRRFPFDEIYSEIEKIVNSDYLKEK